MKVLFQKILLAGRIHPKLTFIVFLSTTVLVLIISSTLSNYLLKEYESKSAQFTGTSPIWERTRGNQTEFFFKRNYQYKVDTEQYDFHFEEGYYNRELTELALTNLKTTPVTVWYDKKDPGEVKFKDPIKLISSPLFIVIHLSGFLFFTGLLIRTVNKLFDDEELELLNKSNETFSYNIISNERIALDFRLKFVIQLILILLIGVFFDHSLEWITIASWLIISIELTDTLRKSMSEYSEIFADISSDLKTQLVSTLKKFGEIFEKHFGVKGKGSIDFDSIEAALFLIILIYLPFIVLPLLLINLIQFLLDLIILIVNVISSFFGKMLLKSRVFNSMRIISAAIYSFIHIGLLVGLLHLLAHTTLIK